VDRFRSVYGQYGNGQNIPPTSVFDVQGALVATLPKPILTDTVQFGSVWKSRRATLDVDVYHIERAGAGRRAHAHVGSQRVSVSHGRLLS
jgi:hypothetical protein